MPDILEIGFIVIVVGIVVSLFAVADHERRIKRIEIAIKPQLEQVITKK